MELVIIIIIGLIALGVVIRSFVRSSKKDKGCCSKYGSNCNTCEANKTDDMNEKKDKDKTQ